MRFKTPFVWHKRDRLNARRKARIHVHPDGMVEVQTPHETSLSGAKQALLKRARWVSQHLQAISARRSEVLERLVSVSDRLPWVSSPPEWSLRVMRSQWGSGSPGGQVLLNPHLVKAPTRCIDYVILHELSHLKEHNHGPSFYALLDQAMQDWQDVKRQLDGMAEMYLNE